MLFVKALLVGGALGGAMTATGRMVCALLGPRWLRWPTAENWARAAFVGTAVWAMLSAWAGYLGATAPQSARILGVVVALLTLCAAWTEAMVSDWPEFRKAVRASGAREVCLVHGPAGNHPGDAFALLYLPDRFTQSGASAGDVPTDTDSRPTGGHAR